MMGRKGGLENLRLTKMIPGKGMPSQRLMQSPPLRGCAISSDNGTEHVVTVLVIRGGVTASPCPGTASYH